MKKNTAVTVIACATAGINAIISVVAISLLTFGQRANEGDGKNGR